MDDKEEGGGSGSEIEIFILIVLVVAIATVWGIWPYVDKAAAYVNTFSASYFVGGLKTVIGVWSGFAIPASLVLIFAILFSTARLLNIRRLEHAAFDAHVQEVYETAEAAEANGDAGLTIRWRKIVELVESQNQNDWRQAIVDADTVMDEILQKGGFIGDSLGERLTNATKGDFRTLDDAWEAHKVRNRIAHDGSAYVLTQHEAQRVINLYKKVFEEFYFI